MATKNTSKYQDIYFTETDAKTMKQNTQESFDRHQLHRHVTRVKKSGDDE